MHAHDFGGLDQSRIGNVATPTEVGEGAVIAKRDGAVFQVLDQLRLVRVVGVLGQGLGLRHRAQLEFGLLTGEFEHLLFNFLKVTLAKGLALKVDIVVKARFDGGANGQKGIRVKVEDGLRQNVRTGVPKRLFSFGLIPGKEDQAARGGQGIVEFHRAAFPFGGQCVLSETTGNRFGHLHGSGSRGVRTDRTVRQCDFNHGFGTNEV